VVSDRLHVGEIAIGISSAKTCVGVGDYVIPSTKAGFEARVSNVVPKSACEKRGTAEFRSRQVSSKPVSG